MSGKDLNRKQNKNNKKNRIKTSGNKSNRNRSYSSTSSGTKSNHDPLDTEITTMSKPKKTDTEDV